MAASIKSLVMRDGLILPLVGRGLLGILLLLILLRLITQFFPQPPENVIRSMYKAQQSPIRRGR